MTNEINNTPSLPREVLDIPKKFIDVGAPPIPQLAAPYSCERIAENSPEAALVAEWMNRPHLATTWEFAETEEWWRERIAAQNAGTYSIPLLLRIDGAPAAYIELYRPGRDVIGATYDARPDDIGIHIGFGDPAQSGQGHARTTLMHFFSQLANDYPQCGRIVFDPDHRSTAARTTALKAGAVDCGIHKFPNRTFNLLVLCRSDADTPVVNPEHLVVNP